MSFTHVPVCARFAGLALALTLAVLPIGCSEAPDPTQAQTADAGQPSGPAPTPDAAVSPSAACVGQDETVAAVLSGQRTSPVLAVAVTNPACGTRTVVAAEGAAPANDALYRVGSVTKTYVAATVLGLEREGKLSLSDAVSKYVDGFPALDTITIGQLANHTSGLFNFTEDPDFGALRKQKRSPRAIVEVALSKPPYFEPGQGFHYSNTNYTLLGMVIEKASGQKVSAAIRTRVLEPLSLARTFFDGEETLPEPLVPGFDTRKRDVTSAEDPSEPWAAGAMVASPSDVSRFHHALFGGSFLDATSQQKLTASPVPTGGASTSYGIAVFIVGPARTRGLGPTLGHGGDIEGFHTESIHFVDHKTTVSAVVNQDGANPSLAVLDVAQALFAK